MNRRIVVAVLASWVLAGGCALEPAAPDLTRPYDSETKMGAIQEEGTLVVGFPTESTPFASSSPRPSGFTVDMAGWVADTLGVELEPVFAPSDELIDAVEKDELDMAFPLTPVTEELVRSLLFADPYYLGHQRLLVPDNSGIRQLTDLTGRSACAYILETGAPLDELAPKVDAITPDEPADCGNALARGTVDAAVGPDVLLMDMAAHAETRSGGLYRLAGDQMTTEGYAVAVTPGNPGFVDFLNSLFNLAAEDGRWTRSFQEHLGPYSDQEGDRPDLTIEDAAALYPIGLEIDDQG